MDAERLSSLQNVADTARIPIYDPAAHDIGIVHLGAGAFHRAHQAVYTDSALAADGGDWRIQGVSLRGTDVADALNPQNGLYTLLERGQAGTSARVIGSIAGVLPTSRGIKPVLQALARPATRIASLTVTEKAYGIERVSGHIDPDHPAIAHDLANPQNPQGAIGLLVEGLRLRRAANLQPFTMLCCDNLPDNGNLLRNGVLDFARQIDPGLADWIETHVAFPSTMVDRITPASTQKTLDDARRLTGLVDLAAVETELFSQWVMEDHFPAGRPAWEIGGAILVGNVAPYERMKLRMLNGAHSLIAYAGFLSGKAFVRDAMADAALANLVRRHLKAAADTLDRIEGIDLADYAEALTQRFANPAIAHETYQIAMDGTEKLPQRILAPAVHALTHGQDIRPFAFATAAWMRYCLGRTANGDNYALRDPREAAINATLSRQSGNAEAISAALHDLDGLFPEQLRSHARWQSDVTEILARMLDRGMAQAIRHEAGCD